MAVLSLIAISFARLMRQEQQQAYERQLHTQAYYAAETAINDARREINQRLLAIQQASAPTGFEGWVRQAESDVTLPGNVFYEGDIAFYGSDIMALGYPDINGGRGEVYIYKQLRDIWQRVFVISDDTANGARSIDSMVVNGLVDTVGLEHVDLQPSYNASYRIGSRFGYALDFDSQGRLAISSQADPAADTNGSGIFIFERVPGTDTGTDNWRSASPNTLAIIAPAINAPNPSITHNSFGSALEFVNDDMLVVGSFRGLDHNPAVNVYLKDTAGNWQLDTTSYPFSNLDKRIYSIAANDSHLVIAYGGIGNATAYTRSGNTWVHAKTFDISVHGYNTALGLALNDDPDHMLLVIAQILSGNDNQGVSAYRYDDDQAMWVEVDGFDNHDATQEVHARTVAGAFRTTTHYAVTASEGGGQAFFYNYLLPIDDTRLIAGQDEDDCRVDTGPLSEPYLDDEETVEYTCVFINTRPRFLSYDSISTERSLVIHLKPADVDTGADKPLTDLYVWWEAEEAPPSPSFNPVPPSFPTLENWGRQAPQ